MLKLICIALTFLLIAFDAHAENDHSFLSKSFSVSLATKTHPNNVLHFQRLGYQNAAFKFYIQSGLHGNELTPVAFTKWLAQRIEQKKSLFNKEFKEDFSIDILPVANPTGYASNSRYNTNGVNLNRNFGVLFGLSSEWMGPKAFSEFETQAIKKILLENHYTAAVDVHGYINKIVTPSQPKSVGSLSRMNLSYAKQYDAWTKLLRQTSMQLENYEVESSADMGDGGAFEDFTYWQAHTLAFCLEMQPKMRFAPTDADFLKYEKFLVSTFKAAASLTSVQIRKETAATDLRLPFTIDINH